MENKKDTPGLTITHLFLQTEGNASHGALLDALHEPSSISCNLVSKSLCLDRCHVVKDTLIYMEVDGQPTNKRAQLPPEKNGRAKTPELSYLLAVVLLDECSGRPLNGLGSYLSLHRNKRLTRSASSALTMVKY